MNTINVNESLNSFNFDTQRAPVELLSLLEKPTKSLQVDTSFKSSKGINLVELRKILNQLNDRELSSALLYDFLQTKANEEMNWGNSITAY